MKNFKHFIGIDIGKFNFVVAIKGVKKSKDYDNDDKGIKNFLNDFKDYLTNSLFILETTGGYEMNLLLNLCSHEAFVHRANTRKVKNFIRSYGNKAKTDHLDAHALAQYGFERQDVCNLFTPASKSMLDLYALIQRRMDLKKMLVSEKNRYKAPGGLIVKKSCKAMIGVLTEEIDEITDKINTLIKSDVSLAQRREILKTIPGIGDITAQTLISLVPELGTMDRRSIASLSGLAPMAQDSGRKQGYRKTSYGRDGVKTALFMAAMAARNSNTELREFYERLVNRGKKKIVALTALMRKIIVIANAKIKHWLNNQLSAQHS